MRKSDKQGIAVLIFIVFIIISMIFVSCDFEKDTIKENVESNSNIKEDVKDSEEIEVIVRPNNNQVSNSSNISNKGSNRPNKVSNKNSNLAGNNNIPITYYVVKASANKIYVGGASKISVIIKPDNATNKKVTYKSSNTNIATVSSDGTIKGISEGTCNIIVNVGGNNTTLTIQILKKQNISNNSSNKTSNIKSNVISNSNKTSNIKSNVTSNSNKVIKVTGVSLDKSNLNISVGNTATLKATVTPNNATNKNISWSSSDTSVATVSSTGVVTGKKLGTATITVKTKDGSKIASTKVNVVQYKTFTATFINNGATSISSGKMSCTTTGTSCTITTPKITRGGWNILGWNTNKDAKNAVVGAGKTVTLTKNTTYYAITSKLITGTFDRTGCSTTTAVKRTCTAYNNSKSCKIIVPTCEKTGVYDNVWSMNKNGTGDLYVANTSIDISGDYRYYPAFKHPYANIVSPSERNSVKVRNFKISKTYKVGSTRFEYESGIPSSAITNHYNFLKKLYSQIPAIFIPGKVFVMTQNTYKNYSTSYGLTTYSGPIAFIDLQYDPKISAISEGANIHELTHGWDGYYGFKRGTTLSQQSDIKTFYKELGSTKTNKLAINEWLAALVPDYYWHYLKNNTSESSNSGYKNNFTSVERNKAVALLNKYFAIAKKGY